MTTEEKIKYDEDLILASALRDPKVVMPIICSGDSPLNFETQDGRYLLDVFKAVQRSKGDLSLVAIDSIIGQQNLHDQQKDLLRARLSHVNNLSLPDNDYIRTTNFAICEIDDVNYDRKTSKRLDELQNIHKSGKGREAILEATLSLYTDLATNLSREEKRSLSSGIDQLIVVEKPKTLVGLSTGYNILDSILYGLRPGLHVVVGDTSSGKSTLLCNIGKNVALNGKKVLVINIEMSKRQWQLKTLSMLSGVDEEKLVAATFSRTTSDKNAVSKAIDLMKSWENSYFYEFVPSVDPSTIRHHIVNYVYRHGVDLIIFDHIKSSDTDSSDRYNTLGNLTKSLKSLSGMLNKPILTAAQGRRPDGVFKKMPTKASVADSYDIMRNADSGWFIQKDSIVIIKNRSGKDDVVIPIQWTKGTSLIKEVKQ